ncbi:sirohydrochlorin cobaltochelatase [Desulfolutivibrio sulfoxidireducens]|uniref:sirohydrochlorin cobaltochelatase n=1 Tax=Desulfolutivibrio sulfoxidireducens TaxID=2773299 RepID=UPI00159E6789|nr:sirohydrochlorin cobaltochelatase [Desulfolutivibrio sulfoxidireducens]QLA21133.1 sirohydrochlorin cobaltochelatase [Desulfolutivibrio sulfoxidireducens]
MPASPPVPPIPDTGIILAAHGSRLPEAVAALEAFARRVAEAHPDCAVRLARTMGEMHRGRHLRPLFAARSLDAAFLEMARLGVTRVAVQSLHVVAGGEFAQVLDVAGRARRGGAFAAVPVGGPLLRDAGDAPAVADMLLASLPGDRAPGEAVAVMGHGARGPAREIYAALAGELSRRDRLVFFSTLDRTREDAARPDSNIGRLRRAILETGAKRAWLVPFFSVAGAHARRDLAGAGEHSWRGILAQAGIECLPALAGLVEIEHFSRAFLARLDAALAGLARPGEAGSGGTTFFP